MESFGNSTLSKEGSSARRKEGRKRDRGRVIYCPLYSRSLSEFQVGFRLLSLLRSGFRVRGLPLRPLRSWYCLYLHKNERGDSVGVSECLRLRGEKVLLVLLEKSRVAIEQIFRCPLPFRCFVHSCVFGITITNFFILHLKISEELKN